MTLNRIISSLITLFVISWGTVAIAQSAQYVEVTGSVLNECDATPVQGARITFEGISQNTSTDEAGNFTIVLRRAENVVMWVRKEGYNDQDLNLDLTAASISRRVRLVPEAGCDTAGVSISVTGFELDNYLSGTVSGIDTSEHEQYKVVVYVKTDIWYIHPYAESFTEIKSDGSWRIDSVHRAPAPTKIAAFLVRKDFQVPAEIKRLGAIKNVAQQTIDYPAR